MLGDTMGTKKVFFLVVRVRIRELNLVAMLAVPVFPIPEGVALIVKT
jgi:hypothetical protein